MELKSFEQLLRNHDWYYQMTDGEPYYKGAAELDHIRRVMKQMWLDDPMEAEQAYKLFQAYSADHRVSI